MVLTAIVIAVLLVIWLCSAVLVIQRLGTSFRQAMLYTPLKLMFRIDDKDMRRARNADAPVIYAVTHQSRLEPALMLSLLPAETLHILDEESAKAVWLEPWRELARTIAFNAGHVFVSRRLVRHLRGKGRLAVYFPDDVEPDVKAFRLYRAVSRIAAKAEARVVPIHIGGSADSLFSLLPRGMRPRRLFPRLTIRALPAMSLAETIAQGGARRATNSNAFFDRMAEARLASQNLSRSIFDALVEAAGRFGPSKRILDEAAGFLSYRALFIRARMLATALTAFRGGERAATGLMLPDSGAFAVTFLALQSAGRIAVPLDPEAGAEAISAAARISGIQTVLTSRNFVEKVGLRPVISELERQGVTITWLEELTQRITLLETVVAQFAWRRPLMRSRADDTAAILFTAGGEGAPKAVALSHRNLLVSAAQIGVRLALSPTDTLVTVLPATRGLGLVAGGLLPLLAGVPLRREVSDASVLVADERWLAAYGQTAGDEDFGGLRCVLACGAPVQAETLRLWRERFGVEVQEAYGLGEATSAVTLSSATHRREGTVGRFLPGIAVRLDPVEGLADGGRLWISGPNIMQGYVGSTRPGEVKALAGDWFDTGDLASVDREGFVTVHGRASRFADIDGEAVSLDAIERLAKVLWPEARHAAVALPGRHGERAVLVTTAEQAERSAMRQAAKRAGGATSIVPAEIVKVPDLPLRKGGMNDYAAARRLALESLGVDRAA